MAATYDVAAQASPSQLAAFIGNDDAMRQHVVPVARRMHEKLTPARFLKQKLTNFGHRARAALPNKAR